VLGASGKDRGRWNVSSIFCGRPIGVATERQRATRTANGSFSKP